MSPISPRKSITLRRELLFTLNIFLLLLFPLSGGSTPSIAKTEAIHQIASPTIVNVSIVDFAFTPKVIKINVGDSVKWTNNGTFIHTSTSNTGAWDSLDIAPSGSYTHTFSIADIYPYHCMHHSLVMTGTVIVGISTFIPLVARGS
jgi:plastocyanin